MTARGTGDVLLKSNLIEQASYQNLSGGGGGKAIAHLIETANRQTDTLMVNSTPIVIRSLSGIFPQSFRDVLWLTLNLQQLYQNLQLHFFY